MMSFLEKIFGSYSKKEIKKIIPIVDKIESLEKEYGSLSDEELTSKTEEFKNRLKNGETLDDILPEAYAVVAEASSRVLGMRHFRVQLIGGIILHQGRIAEMKTGEGKTLVATLPLYLNALSGKGAHLVTVNDYLAKLGSVWMGKLYKFLGLSVGLVVNGMSPEEKRKAYNADITYGTNNEFGFDYLRDNMTMSKESMVQRELNYAIVDEIDSILIDEARTPLIISGMVNKQSDLYISANKFAKGLKAKVIVENNDKEFDASDDEFDYIVDLKAHTVALTDTGTKKAEKYFGIESLSDIDNMSISHHVNQAIRAYGLMKKDKDYIVRDGQVLIVDEFTGRIMDGRRYSDGLHQAIEAKENVKIESESQTLATITFQNYFRLYHKLAGMTGTAKTEEEEFKGIYKLDVIEIPTNKPVIREDLNDVVYKTEVAKYNAIVDDVEDCYKRGQPVLVGTVSIDKSEIISRLLTKKKIPHQVLNAKYHEKEAEIIAQAGKYKSVTIATNMAGRGTDIMLGGNLENLVRKELRSKGYTEEIIELAVTPIHNDNPDVLKAREDIKSIEAVLKPQIEEDKKKVIEAGGLRVIGSERHESRRIDNQLRGRSGRQGDPGSSKFYIALEDDLMKLFGSDKMTSMINMLNLPDDVPIEQKMLTNVIENAQRKIEGIHYSSRKSVLEYDDVMNKQREIIYSQRRTVLDSENIFDVIKQLYMPLITNTVNSYFKGIGNVDEVELASLDAVLRNLFGVENILTKEDISSLDEESIINIIANKVERIYQENHKNAKELGAEEELERFERYFILKIVNEKWMDHIDAMTELKDGIGLRGYAQVNPLEAYKIESFNMFEELIRAIQEDSTKAIFSLRAKKNDNYSKAMQKEVSNVTNIRTSGGGSEPSKREPVKSDKKIGRNEPCPCGSGKKYKHCCGKNA
ncbi:MAG: preprotein translocase subunit SecA [Clostridia bacterium]|nr:preprotein translocase subunit SecA [Clostridia bacterium]